MSVTRQEAGVPRARAVSARPHPEDAIDFGISLETRVRLGQEVAAGEELARVYLRREDERLVEAFATCFTVGEQGEAPPLIAARID
jgi:thymidine phosphorylase